MIHLAHLFKGDGLRAQVLKGAGGTALVRASSMLLMLASGVLLARSLGPENYGIYSFVLSLIALLGLPANAGLPTLLVRETAKSQAVGRWGLVKGLLQISTSAVFVYSAIIALSAAFVVYWIWEADGSSQVDTFLWALWLLPIIAFEGVRTGVLRGLRWVAISQIPEQIIRPALIIALLGTAIVLDRNVTAIQAVQFNIGAALIASLVGAFFLFKAFPKHITEVQPEYNIKPWFWSLLPLSIFAGLRMLDSQINILVLGLLGSSEEVGLFRVAVTGASLVTFGLTAINMALAPQVARMYQAGDMQKLQRMITLTTRGAVLVSLPIATIFMLWGEQLLGLVFGPEYVAAATALAILCLAQIIDASCGSVAVVLNMTGNDTATVTSTLISLLLNLALAVALIPQYGLLGAALGYMVSLVSWNVMLAIVARKKTGLITFLQ